MRSAHSLLTGASSVEALLGKAQACGFRAMALTDEGSLGGAVEFFQRAGAFGVRPILGAIIDGAVLLVESGAGYRNLCELLSARNLDAKFSLVARLPEHQEGLVVLAPSAALVSALAGRLEGGRLWAELPRPAPSRRGEAEFLAAARRAGAEPVASADVFFAEPDDFEAHAALVAMGENSLLDEVRPRLAARRGCWLRTGEEMSRLFADLPEALANTVRVAERCRFDLLGLRPAFPKLPGDGPARLREAVTASARRRHGAALPAPVAARVERELGLIVAKGFADYFLVVADIVRHARVLGTPVAGRGSGASSLVAYLLGITNVDPLEFNLPFERFLNESRADFPDLDVDFCWRLRDEVLAYVFRTYGAEHAAMIATVATLQPRAALREVGRVLGLAGPAISVIERKLRHGLPREKWEALPADPGTVERLVALSRRVEGLPHHLSVHCGGVVLTPDRVAGHAPLLRAAKGVVITEYDKDAVEAVGLVKLDLLGNRALSSMGEALRLSGAGSPDPDRIPAEDPPTAALLAAGDTVGVGQLESPAMRHLLRQMRPRNARGLMQALALIRPGAAALGMKETFVRRVRGLEPAPPLDPRLDGILAETHGILLYEDDALLVAAALTGLPPGEADRFRRAVSKCRSDDERRRLSEDFLGRCRIEGERYYGGGAPCGQPEFSGVGGTIQPWPPKADRVELAAPWTTAHAGDNPIVHGTPARSINHGCPPPPKTPPPASYYADLWTQMAKFNAYSFCRAHAASYARLSWANAWLKAHRKLEFWVAALNNNASMYPGWVYVEEARRAGIRTMLPCVNRSGREFGIEAGAIRVGLGRVRGLSDSSAASVLASRPFAGLADFLARTSVKLAEAEALVRAGALDFTGRPRPEMLLELHTSFPSGRRAGAAGEALVPFAGVAAGLPRLGDRPPSARRRDEWELLELSVAAHPLAGSRPRLARLGAATSGALALPAWVGRKIRLAGVVAARRTVRTDSGGSMCFLTLSDEDGLFEVTVFPPLYRQARSALSGAGLGPLVVAGVVEDQYGALSVRATEGPKGLKRRE